MGGGQSKFTVREDYEETLRVKGGCGFCDEKFCGCRTGWEQIVRVQCRCGNRYCM